MFTAHEKKNYHQESLVIGNNLLKTSRDQNLDIRNIVDAVRKKQVEENREKLIPIVETIKLCERQELALRGTDDSGPIFVKSDEPVVNDGNFRNFSGDEKLIRHVENVALNASYISPNIQNQLIIICGQIVQEQIVENINDAHVFSILADETSDTSRQEQMSLCVRYTENMGNIYVVKEDFLCFVHVETTTGEYLANTIVATLQNLGIDCNNMIGQGYDGAAAMKGSFKGVQSVIKKTYPEALYVHCCSHSLNLALCHSCNLPAVRNCIGTAKSIATFLKASPRRTTKLQEYIKTLFPETRWKTLTAMCETRWVENHHGLFRFKEIFSAIGETLEDLSIDGDMDTSSKASSFLKSMMASEFVISFCFLESVFSYTITLCKMLQSPLCDLVSSIDYIENVVQIFENFRTNIEAQFSIIFKTAKSILDEVHEEIRIPRLTSVQRYRSNFQTNDPEQYFRIAVAIPVLDDFIGQLKSRFVDHKNILSGLYCLLPSVCCDKSLDLENLAMYKNIDDLSLLQNEYELWKICWSRRDESDRPSCAIEALGECNAELYPNIFMLLKIYATLPVTICTPERSFSTLKRLKSYLRNSCGPDRLTGLALMSIHRDIVIPTDKVINIFVNKKRKLDFVL
ncbi:52 kDa repressor of the inhibitor of the protein kinase [Leptinotarsa decemlineata]|uniref:52 kDa repressor of the inhibitor of the protein kinase n=1 Tax=Leptinotarsa decemlineata TaxID=7539 RepID=UPI003D30C9C1